MVRKMLLVIAALAGAAVMFAPTGASARGFRGRGRGFGWGGPAIGFGLGLGLAGAYPYYGYPYGYYRGGCWRRVIVNTPYGPRPRRVWVC